jgi:hypothetical protein
MCEVDVIFFLLGSSGSSHAISEEETVAFFSHINNCLASKPLLSKHLPLDPYAEDVYTKFQDGLILVELLNMIKPGKRFVRCNAYHALYFAVKV